MERGLIHRHGGGDVIPTVDFVRLVATGDRSGGSAVLFKRSALRTDQSILDGFDH